MEAVHALLNVARLYGIIGAISAVIFVTGLVSYVVAGPDGKALGPEALKYVSAPIEIEGDVERVGDLLIFKIDLGSVRRL